MCITKRPAKATVTERITAFFVIGFWGLLLGLTFGWLIFSLVFGYNFFAYWYFAFAFGLIGFVFPRNTERFWSPFWMWVLKHSRWLVP